MTLREKEALVSDLNVAAIRQRAEQATPGPWIFRVLTGKRRAITAEDGAVMIGAVAPGHQIRANPPGGTYPSRDGEFIAHAREDIPALLAQLALLEAQQTALRGALEKLIASSMLPQTCSHGEAPDYCDGCRYEMERAAQAARIHARAALAYVPLPPAPSPKGETP